MGNRYYFGSGTGSRTGDTEAMTLAKILKRLNFLSGLAGGTLDFEMSTGTGAPTHTPDSNYAIYVDSSTQELYFWYSGAWH